MSLSQTLDLIDKRAAESNGNKGRANVTLDRPDRMVTIGVGRAAWKFKVTTRGDKFTPVGMNFLKNKAYTPEELSGELIAAKKNKDAPVYFKAFHAAVGIEVTA